MGLISAGRETSGMCALLETVGSERLVARDEVVRRNSAERNRLALLARQRQARMH